MTKKFNQKMYRISAVEFLQNFKEFLLFPKCRLLQIVIGQKLFQWFQQLSQNSNTSCQKYPPRSQNKKAVNIHLQWWTEHQVTLSLKVHHLKLFYWITQFDDSSIHLHSRLDPKIPKYVCQDLISVYQRLSH